MLNDNLIIEFFLLIFLISYLILGVRAVEIAELRQCLDNFENITSLNSVCQSSNNSAVLAGEVRNHIDACLQANMYRNLRISVPNASLLPAIRRHATAFQEKHNITVELNVLEVLETATGVHDVAQLQVFSDGWIIDPAVIGDLAAANALAELTSYAFSDQDLKWPDISKFYRMNSANFNKRIIGVPLDGDLLLMYYRRDLFDRYKLSVPVTWEEFAELARKMNGTDTDGDGVGDLWGTCFDNAKTTCKSPWILTAVLAPYVQYLGTKQGIYIDPSTMKPLINNPAMIRAVQLYRSLFSLAPRPAECLATNPFFSNGSCLMTINFGDQFKVSAQLTANNSNRRQLNGSILGISRLPGSLEVLNRTTGMLVTCTNATCPHAQLVRLANGSQAWANFAPFSAFGGWMGMVNARSSQDYQSRAFKFFSYISKPDNSIDDVLDLTSGIDPYRSSHLQPSAENLARWTSSGYDADATLAYLQVISEDLGYDNVVLDIRLQSMANVTRTVLAAVADNTTWGNQPIDELLLWGQAAMESELNHSGANPRELQLQYWQLIGDSPGDGKGPRQDQKQGERLNNGAIIDNVSTRGGFKGTLGLAVLIPLGTVLLAVVVGLLVWRRVTGHRSLLYGAVKAPMAGPQTTLLITDIQDSTSLWEALPDAVMDAALKVHHAVVRQALVKHVGYESATEGDSFILAFHSAEDAVACAMRIQMDLLTAKWPPELLRCTECTSAAEIWVGPPRGALQQHSALLEMLGGSAISWEQRGPRRRWPVLAMVRDSCGAVTGAPRGLLGGCAAMWPSISRPTAGLKVQPSLPQQQQVQQSPNTPSSVATTNTNNGAAAVEIKTLAAMQQHGTTKRDDSSEEAGPKHRNYQEEQRQLGRLSTTSGDDDTTVMVSSNWSASQEGLLSRGSSQYREETQTGSLGWLGGLANILSRMSRSRGQQMYQNQQYQHLISTIFMSSDNKSEQQYGNKSSWSTASGGAPCITTAGVMAAAATATAGTGAGGAIPGRLFKEHIRSIWLVVDTGQCTFRTVDTATVIPTSSGTCLKSTLSRREGAVTTVLANNETETTLAPPPNLPAACASPSLLQLTIGCAVVGRSNDSSNQNLSPTAVVSGTPLLQAHAIEVEMAAEVAITARNNTLLQPQQEQQLQLPLQQLRIPQQQQPTVFAYDSAVGSPASRQHAIRQLLAFRGLRVRMGIHSGVPDSEHVLYNQAEARYHYSGIGMALARAVQGAAAGGQVLLSDSTFALVRGGCSSKRLRDAVLIHAGEHVLDTKLPAAQQAYQALPRQLLCRLALQPPLKVMRTVAAGALDAPVGRVAVAFLTVVGAATLQGWNSDVMQHALSIFQEIFWTAAAANATRGAYLVEFTSEGLLLATFASTADALATCMAVQSELLVADWPRVLLEHDMCEEVTIATPQPGGTIVREVLFRGLRVKAGVDCGPARAALNGATGRIAYRGRVMNRAARINARGSSGQVLCSRSAWQAASEAEEGGPAARGLAALSLGHMALKGIGEPVEILEIRPHVLAPPPSSQQSTLMGRIMLASHPSRGSLTPLASDATAISTVVVAGASLRPTSSITAQTLPCPSNGGGGAPARVSTCPSPVKVAPVSSVALCDGPDISRLNRRDGMMAAAAAAASIATAAATASDNSRTGGDLARLPSDAGAVLLQHSGSSFPGGSRLLPQASSVAQLQTAQIQRAVPESKWFPRSISRLDSGIEQPLPNLPATEDMLATATFPPPPTVQVFRIDTTTGIAALELPSPFPAPAPSPAPAPAMMETGTASAAVSAGGSTEVPAPLSMMIGIDG